MPNTKSTIPIRYRTFLRNPTDGVYSVIVRADQQVSGDALLVISTVGDDLQAPAEIKSARLANGEELPVGSYGTVGPVKLRQDQPIRLEVVLRDPIRVAMDVAARLV